MKCLLHDLSTIWVFKKIFSKNCSLKCIHILILFCFVYIWCKNIFLIQGLGFSFRLCAPEMSMFRPLGPDNEIIRLFPAFFRQCGKKEPGFRPCEPNKTRFKPCEPRKSRLKPCGLKTSRIKQCGPKKNQMQTV